MSSLRNYQAKFISLASLLIFACYLMTLCIHYNIDQLKVLDDSRKLKESKNDLCMHKKSNLDNEHFIYQPLCNFYESWKNHLKSNPDKILADWDLISQKLNVAIISKEIVPSKSPFVRPQFKITLEGTVSNIMDWLGQIEEKYPLVKIDSTKLSVAGCNLKLDMIASLIHL